MTIERLLTGKKWRMCADVHLVLQTQRVRFDAEHEIWRMTQGPVQCSEGSPNSTTAFKVRQESNCISIHSHQYQLLGVESDGEVARTVYEVLLDREVVRVCRAHLRSRHCLSSIAFGKIIHCIKSAFKHFFDPARDEGTIISWLKKCFALR